MSTMPPPHLNGGVCGQCGLQQGAPREVPLGVVVARGVVVSGESRP